MRCQSLLDLASVDFLPPRAARGRPGRRLRATAQTIGFRLRECLLDVGRSLQMPDDFRPRGGDLPWLLLPGGMQIRSRVRGLRLLGWLTLFAWCLLLCASLASLGTWQSSMLALCAVSVHGFGISLAFAPMLQSQPVPHRLAFGLALYVCLLFGLYWPAAIGLRRFVNVIPINGVIRQPVVANGDVLLYTGRWFRPRSWRRGELVVTAMEPRNSGAVMIAGGYNVDRIIGLPGDTVHMDSGVLIVNGKPAPPDEQPIAGTANLPAMEITLGDGDFLVYPSSFQWTAHGNWRQVLAGGAPPLGVIDDDSLLGRVIVRVRPWSRAGLPGSEHP